MIRLNPSQIAGILKELEEIFATKFRSSNVTDDYNREILFTETDYSLKNRSEISVDDYNKARPHVAQGGLLPKIYKENMQRKFCSYYAPFCKRYASVTPFSTSPNRLNQNVLLYLI